MATLTLGVSGPAPPSFGLRHRRFQPRLALGHQQNLSILVAELLSLPSSQARNALDSAIQALDNAQAEFRVVGLAGSDLEPTIRYAATLRVLRDLVNQGWTIRVDDEGVILDAPGREAVRLDDPELAKEAVRRSFAFAREAQLGEPATLDFIEAMERRHVGSLFANGSELANRLTMLLVSQVVV